MSKKPFRPKPISIKLGDRKATLRVDYPLKDDHVFPVLMAQADKTLHAFVRSGHPSWINKTDAERRQYINQLLGPEYVERVVMHPDIELRLEMDKEHFIMRNGDMVEVFSLKTPRLIEYLEAHDKQIQFAQPVVKQLLQIEHVLDDIITRDDVWNSKDLTDCLDAHPTVDAVHRLKVGANSLNYGFTLRNEHVTITINFTTDTKLFNIGRGEVRIDGCSHYYTINGVDGLKFDTYSSANKALVEQQAEQLVRKLVDYIMSHSAHEVEPV